MSLPVTATASSAYLTELALSGALDEISNGPGSVRHHIRNHGVVRSGVTRKAMLFVIYQTGRYGPQNGFRLCLVHEGFEVRDEDESGGQRDAVDDAEMPVAQGATEIIRLGVPPPPIADP
ncbi:hypothetical protein V496_04188 [Pseudogymnoascus sp. VKM F-4515 (FW-2607)]|nr:hypothetical protein V496_04188 [Pseudogymnoascus sp. VKM F-4515 (FW-2607)]KFY95998.1 hypothetical protein V498_02957 [Pseudogymnoascus sp. VKM F-4517 (FW-2822)]